MRAEREVEPEQARRLLAVTAAHLAAARPPPPSAEATRRVLPQEGCVSAAAAGVPRFAAFLGTPAFSPTRPLGAPRGRVAANAVSDPGRQTPGWGGEEGYARLSARLQEAG